MKITKQDLKDKTEDASFYYLCFSRSVGKSFGGYIMRDGVRFRFIYRNRWGYAHEIVEIGGLRPKYLESERMFLGLSRYNNIVRVDYFGGWINKAKYENK